MYKDIMYNDLSAIDDFEFVKTFYLRRKNLITEDDFQNTIFNLSENINRERLLECDLMEEYGNGELSITSFGIRLIEHFTIMCNDCGETVYFNIFSPLNICPKCGEILAFDYKMALEKDNCFGNQNGRLN